MNWQVTNESLGTVRKARKFLEEGILATNKGWKIIFIDDDDDDGYGDDNDDVDDDTYGYGDGSH